MSAAPPINDRLFNLLPAIHRQRDLEQAAEGSQSGPLRALLQVIGEQVTRVDDDIAQLYRNWFIETCDDWVVPYIGDLVGFRALRPSDGSAASTADQQRRDRLLVPRRAVARTVSDRRRRGTLAVLEELARDVAGWPAKAVEFYRLLGWTQHLDHPHPDRGRLVDLRDGDRLELIEGPLDAIAHTVDIRGIGRALPAEGPPPPRVLPSGRYSVPMVALFVWRLRSYSVTRTPAFLNEAVASNAFTFSILGNDTPLFNRVAPRTRPGAAREIDLPTPIRRRAFQERVLVDGVERTAASAAYYGSGEDQPGAPRKSVTLWAPGWPKKDSPQPIPRESIIPADLTSWRTRTPRSFVAVDPLRGRILFPAGQVPKNGVFVNYQYGFAADFGGGEYPRRVSQPPGSQLFRVGRGAEHTTINAALDAWGRLQPKPSSAVIEIVDSGAYTEPLRIELGARERLQLRAAAGRRPVLRLLDYMSDRPDALAVAGGAGSSLVLDGLMVTGRGLRVYGPDPGGDEDAGGDLCEIVLRHCTLVPGWGLNGDCNPREPNEPSLELVNTRARVQIEHSILGSIDVAANEVVTDPIRVKISDSILDATRDDRAAIAAQNLPLAFVSLDIRRSTVFGEIQAHAIELAEDCLFTGVVRVARRQIGCVRTSYVPPGSRTPRREGCQPDLVDQAVAAMGGAADDPARLARRDRERARVRPAFISARYGRPDYARLADATAVEITEGAGDGGELGVYHDLRTPERAANLAARAAEFIPADSDIDVLFST